MEGADLPSHRDVALAVRLRNTAGDQVIAMLATGETHLHCGKAVESPRHDEDSGVAAPSLAFVKRGAAQDEHGGARQPLDQSLHQSISL
jgi:hypothetical protein